MSKPLDLKIEWLRDLGLGVEQRGEMFCVFTWAAMLGDRGRGRALIFFGNPTYRLIRERLQAHFPRYIWRRS